MKTAEEDDSTFEAGLGGLPVRDADPECVARIRTRCLAALARRRHRQVARRQVVAHWRSRLEAAAATGLAALFLAAAVERALEILG